MRNYRKKLESKVTMTPEEEQEFLETKNCFVCQKHITDNDKHRHHNHSKRTLRGKNGEVLQSNFVGACCFECNIKISNKKSRLSVWAHNGMHYDNHFVINDIPKGYKASFLLKSEQQFLEIRIDPPYSGEKTSKKSWRENVGYGLSFKDTRNHMSTSLAQWAQDYKNDGLKFDILEKTMKNIDSRYTPEVVQMCTQKGVFPYEFIDSQEKLDETQPKSDLYHL